MRFRKGALLAHFIDHFYNWRVHPPPPGGLIIKPNQTNKGKKDSSTHLKITSSTYTQHLLYPYSSKTNYSIYGTVAPPDYSVVAAARFEKIEMWVQDKRRLGLGEHATAAAAAAIDEITRCPDE